MRFVLPSHADQARVKQLERSRPWKLYNTALFISLVDLQPLPANKEDVWQVQLQRLHPSRRQPVQDPLHHLRTLHCTSIRKLRIQVLFPLELLVQAQLAIAHALVMEVILRVNSGFEIFDEG